METLFARDGRAFSRYSLNDKDQPVASVKRTCWRCGGAGGADKWQHTGWTCYRCNGKGTDPTPEIVRLYTADKNASLDAAQAKRGANKEAKRIEAARIEKLRRDAERAELISEHSVILTRIGTHVFGSTDRNSAIDFLDQLQDQVNVKVKPLSEKQMAAATRIMDARDKEAARKAAAHFIGEVGERLEFTITLGTVYSDEISQFPAIWSYTVYCKTDDGCTVVYKGGSTRPVGHTTVPFAGDYVYPVNRKVKVKATVKKHYTSAKGEPITVIQRPKVIEIVAEGDIPGENA